MGIEAAFLSERVQPLHPAEQLEHASVRRPRAGARDRAPPRGAPRGDRSGGEPRQRHGGDVHGHPSADEDDAGQRTAPEAGGGAREPRPLAAQRPANSGDGRRSRHARGGRRHARADGRRRAARAIGGGGEGDDRGVPSGAAHLRRRDAWRERLRVRSRVASARRGTLAGTSPRSRSRRWPATRIARTRSRPGTRFTSPSRSTSIA